MSKPLMKIQLLVERVMIRIYYIRESNSYLNTYIE